MSFPRYPSYKDSGVEWLGEVPEHWEVTLTKRYVTVKSGDMISATEETEEGFPLIGGNGLRAHTNKWNSPGDTLVIGRVGAKCGCVHLIEEDFWASEHAFRVIEKQPLSKHFFFHLFSALDLNKFAIKTAQPLLNTEIVETQWVSVPTLPEQTQIATFLDRETAKIDELVAEQRRLMELLKEKRRAVISHAVTKGLNPDSPMKPSGNKWLGNVPANWVLSRLKHVKAETKNAFVDGPFGSNLKSEHFIDDGDVYVIESNFATQGRIETEGLKTISNEHFVTINRSETRGGDIIIAKIGAQYGKASILPTLDKPAVVSGNSLKLTINQKLCDVNFVNWHLANLKELGVMEDIVNATAQPALSLGEMNNLPMLVPPLAEQVAIVRFLDEKLCEFDALTAEAQRAIDLLQERRTALISAAVTGQIDVRAAL